MSLKPQEIYLFGPYRLDAGVLVLFRDERPVPLTPKQVQTLVVLVRAQGSVVSREQLVNEVWPDTFVEEAGLTRNISVLRKALEADGGPPCIETLPKRGYRFVAAVLRLATETAQVTVIERHATISVVEEIEEIDEAPPLEPAPLRLTGSKPPASGSRRLLIGVGVVALIAFVLGSIAWRRTPPTDVAGPEAIRSFAVLPFRHLNPGPNDGYLGVGLADVLITRFANFSAVSVTSTSTALRYQGKDAQAAGRELGVDAVLDGTIRQSDNRVRVTVQLLSVATGLPLWAGSFDEPLGELLLIEDAVSNSVAGLLAPRLGKDERLRLAKRSTANPDAWQAYLRGRALWATRSVADIEESIRLFDTAIRADPGYALAYAGLAQSLIVQGDYQYRWPRDVYPRARQAATRAIELDGSLADAHGALAAIAWEFDWDWSTADHQFTRALALNPNDATLHQWRAEYLVAMGRTAEALTEIDTAIELDRQGFAPNAVKAQILFRAHRFEESAAHAERTMLLPGNVAAVALGASLAYHHLGRVDESRAAIDKARALVGGIPAVVAFTARHDGVSGRRVLALEQIRSLERQRDPGYVDPIFIAGAYLGMADTDHSLQWVRQATIDRSVFAAYLAADPTFEELTADPRFVDILRGVGLLEASERAKQARR